MKAGFVATFLAALTLCLAAGVSVASAGGSTTNGTGHCNPSDPACGANPLLTGPVPPFVTVQGNCPAWLSSDAWALNFVDGKAVFHGTENKNGDWGGFTAQGPAVLASSDGTTQYTGHATEWGGGGNNSGGQTEGGFTLNFNGSGPAGAISIHVNQHSTTNNAGTPTSNFLNATVSCG
jgi:hypothetical protein